MGRNELHNDNEKKRPTIKVETKTIITAKKNTK